MMILIFIQVNVYDSSTFSMTQTDQSLFSHSFIDGHLTSCQAVTTKIKVAGECSSKYMSFCGHMLSSLLGRYLEIKLEILGRCLLSFIITAISDFRMEVPFHIPSLYMKSSWDSQSI
jgi:hypothetical protein